MYQGFNEPRVASGVLWAKLALCMFVVVKRSKVLWSVTEDRRLGKKLMSINRFLRPQVLISLFCPEVLHSS